MRPERPDRSAEQAAAQQERGDAVHGFAIEVHPEREAVRLVPIGELDLLTARSVRERVDELLDAGFTQIVIDLRGLAFMDSTGLRLLLGLHQHSQHDGWSLSLIQGREPVRRVFDITGTSTVLPFTDGSGPPESGRPPSR